MTNNLKKKQNMNYKTVIFQDLYNIWINIRKYKSNIS